MWQFACGAAQHSWAPEFVWTNGKSLFTAPWQRCVQGFTQQHGAPSSQHLRRAAGHADGSASLFLGSTCGESSLGRDLRAVHKRILAAKAEMAQLQSPRSLRELSRCVPALTGETLSSTAGVLERPSVREFLERPDGRWSTTPCHAEMLVINELSVTAHALRLPSYPPVGTDLVVLRDECTSSCASCGHPWSGRPSGSHRLPQSPPTAVSRMWDGAQVGYVSNLRCRASVSGAFAPSPADLEKNTRASGKRQDTHNNTLIGSRYTCARRVTARAVGGLAVGPRFVVGWLLAPPKCSATAATKVFRFFGQSSHATEDHD